jgi:VIT1/CCC1 family predicted Fe2+/Mn2+ transporter
LPAARQSVGGRVKDAIQSVTEEKRERDHHRDRLAEEAAGAIAMGLGGFLAARTDIEHYRAEYGREMRQTVEMPNEERAVVRGIFREQGLDRAQAEGATALTQHRERWVRFMMRFELGLEEPDPKRAVRSALTIGSAYVAGGLVPLLPYMLLPAVKGALLASVILTLVTLFLFDAIKGRLTRARAVRGGTQTVLVGGLAAGAAFAIARLVGG